MDVEFPILGQNLAIELANTLWVHAGREIDALSTGLGAQRWLAAMSPRLPEAEALADVDIDDELLRALVALRQSIRTVLVATIDGASPPDADVARLNGASRAAPGWLELEPSAAHPHARRVRRGDPGKGVLAALADDAIGLVASPESNLLVRCPGPGCLGVFVRGDPRQRFCSSTCSNRSRAAEHYRRRKGKGR